MAYEIWEETYHNAIDDFESEEEALAFVRETVELRGEKAVASWAMDVADDQPMLRGRELLKGAMTVHV